MNLAVFGETTLGTEKKMKVSKTVSYQVTIYVYSIWFWMVSSVLTGPLTHSRSRQFRQVGISENIYIATHNTSLDKVQQVCVIDNTVYYEDDSVPTTSPCEQCVCKPPGFACNAVTCEYKSKCKMIQRNGQCCPEYECDCEKDDLRYKTGEKIWDPKSPCEVCYCQEGEIICTLIRCYTRNDCEPMHVQGRCCPSYDHCQPFPGRPLRPIRPLPPSLNGVFANETTMNVSHPPVSETTSSSLTSESDVTTAKLNVDLNSQVIVPISDRESDQSTLVVERQEEGLSQEADISQTTDSIQFMTGLVHLPVGLSLPENAISSELKQSDGIAVEKSPTGTDLEKDLENHFYHTVSSDIDVKDDSTEYYTDHYFKRVQDQPAREDLQEKEYEDCGPVEKTAVVNEVAGNQFVQVPATDVHSNTQSNTDSSIVEDDSVTEDGILHSIQEDGHRFSLIDHLSTQSIDGDPQTSLGHGHSNPTDTLTLQTNTTRDQISLYILANDPSNKEIIPSDIPNDSENQWEGHETTTADQPMEFTTEMSILEITTPEMETTIDYESISIEIDRQHHNKEEPNQHMRNV